MEYEKILKHMKKLTESKRNKRAVNKALRGAYHFENSITATDSCRLLYVEMKDKAFKEQILNLKTDETIEEEYPDTKRLFMNKEDISKTINLDTIQISSIKSILTCIKALKFKSVELKKVDDYWYIKPKYRNYKDDYKADENLDLSYKIAKDIDSKEQTRIIDTDYLLTAMNFLKDTKEDTTIQINKNKFAPIQIEQVNNEIKYKYLIMPIREY